MDSKKYQVFVSSTYTDLEETRRVLMEAIQRLNHFPVGMEQFSADDDEQWEIIRETLGQTDYYICIIGHRYGSLSRDGRSFTEREWDYASELGIPIMTFVRDRNVATTPSERETDPDKIKRLDAFVKKTTATKMVDFWTSPGELNGKVITALSKAFSRKPRPGWIRSESSQVAEQLAILVEENRGLRNKVEKLTSAVEHAKPKFEIELNGQPTLVLKFVSDGHLKLTTIPYLPEISWEQVPENLKRFTSEEKIERYNSQRAAVRNLEAQVAEIRRLERIKVAGYRLDICVSNTGSAKARQIYLDLEFPEAVLILEKDEWADLTIPELDAPENPILAAEAKRKEAEANPLGYLRNQQSLDFIRGGVMPRDVLRHITAQSRSIRVEKNKITIWMEDLMHTRARSFRDIVIVPLQEGIFSIKGTLICEEIGIPQIFEFPLSIGVGTSKDLPDPESLLHN